MKRAILGRTTNDLRQELVLLKEGARIAAAKFEELRRQAESFKIKALRRHLEDRRRHVARSRGFTLVSRNGKRLGTSLGIAAAGSIIAGMVTKDKRAAANAGLSTFYSVLKEAGKTDCAVCLEKRFTVAPRDKITSEGLWVTWESINAALRQLEAEALSGAPLGSLDSIISRLRQSAGVVALNQSTVKPITFVAKLKPTGPGHP